MSKTTTDTELVQACADFDDPDRQIVRHGDLTAGELR